MATDNAVTVSVSKARGFAQLVFVAAVPAMARTFIHLINALRHPINVSGALNAALLALLVTAMFISHVRFMRQLIDPPIGTERGLVRFADAESSVVMLGFFGILLALGFPFSIG